MNPNLKTTKTKKPKLTKKQADFVREYVRTGNGTQAALKAYDIESPQPHSVASVIAAENLVKPSVAQAIEIEQETLKSALIKQGITPEKIAEKIEVLLNATEPIYKNNNETGEIEHVGDKTDFTAIDKGIKHATNIYGIEDPSDKPRNQTTYNFIFNAETQEKIQAIEAEIKAKLIGNNA
jgi:hypothetical protein